MSEAARRIDADYVVVGAGSSGCVVASRLAERLAARVVLLEAGPEDRSFWIRLPIGFFRTIFDPRFGWGYSTLPEAELDGRELPWPRGRVLGGSSSINGLVVIRGQREDYDHWASLGNLGWGFEDVLPLFRRSEDHPDGDGPYHGAGGPMGVTAAPYRHPICDAFIEAAQALGIPRNDDFNGAGQFGAGYFHLNTRRGWRSSSATAYLRPRRELENLRIETLARASRITFDGCRATGVLADIAGVVHDVRATREVIVCAGAIGSPLLLERSGIGDGARLRSLGIPVLSDLPGVGENLQDHLTARVMFRARNARTLNEQSRSLLGRALMALRFAARRDGPLALGAGQAGLFAPVTPGELRPEVQFHFGVLSTDNPRQGLHDFPGFTASVCQLRPASRGSVHSASRDPGASPEIRANYLTAEEDKRVLTAGVRLARQLGGTAPLSHFVESEYMPGPDCRSDGELLAYLRARAGTIYHPVGTCRMGAGRDAVVDAGLRVRGAQGLRVADASIMPTLVSGNTHAPCVMIGEKAADLICMEVR